MPPGDLNENLQGESIGMAPSETAGLRNEDEEQEKQNAFYEGVVGQPLPSEGEVSRVLQRSSSKCIFVPSRQKEARN